MVQPAILVHTIEDAGAYFVIHYEYPAVGPQAQL